MPDPKELSAKLRRTEIKVDRIQLYMAIASAITTISVLWLVFATFQNSAELEQIGIRVEKISINRQGEL